MKTLLFKESLDLTLLLFALMFLFKGSNIVFFGCLTLLLLLVHFHRLPKRAKPKFGENVITAPSDGTVLSVTEEDGMYHIVIYLAVTDVHVQWFPVDGIVRNIIYKHGTFDLAHILKKSQHNERMTTIIENPNGIVRIDQIAGQLARRIVNWSISNSYVKRGNLLGMIKLSSRVDLYIPSENTEVFVKPNDKLVGKLTPVAKWKKIDLN